MKIFKYPFYLIGLLSVTAVFSSCENRTDIFKQRNIAPKVIVSTTSGVFTDSLQTLDISIRHGNEITIYFDDVDDKEIIGDNKFEYSVVSTAPAIDIEYELFQAEQKLVIRDKIASESSIDYPLWHTIKIYVTDYYGDQGFATITLSSVSNKAPQPTIKLTKLEGMEYTVSAETTTDPDGDNIVAYEYSIDPTSIDYSFGGYESVIGHGNGALGGTYIVSTPLTSIKHAFQTTGTHTVNIRAKDSNGLWSKWSMLTVEIDGSL